MYCKVCGEFFQPSQDEEKLIVSGSVEEVCGPCAARLWKEKSDREFTETPIYPRAAVGGDGTTLCRAEWYTKTGKLISFVSLPPILSRYEVEPLHQKKVADIRVFVFGSNSRTQYRILSEPSVILHTNLDTFKDLGAETFWVRKRPDYCNAHTGVGSIEVDARRVKNIERKERLIEVTLTDGSCIRMFYR